MNREQENNNRKLVSHKKIRLARRQDDDEWDNNAREFRAAKIEKKDYSTEP